jgi:hypothetical protein
VQEIARIAGPCTGSRERQPARPEQRIADERMARRGEMDPHLVRAAGLDAHIAQEGVAAPLDDRHVRHGALARSARRVHRAERPMR